MESNMFGRPVDPASLEGDELTHWYQRSAWEVEQERQAAAAQHYTDFFGMTGGPHVDPSFSRELAPSAAMVDPAFDRGPQLPRKDIDPGFSRASIGPNRRLGEPLAAPKQAQLGYSATAATAAAPTPRPTQEDEMAKLRREQAAFKEVVREESRRNSWMAIPALAPMLVPLLAEGAALLTGRLAASQLNRVPLNLLSREPGLARAPLSEVERNALRTAARTRVAQANGQPASQLAGQVHHRVALRFAHLFPNADPNRLANLVPLMRQAHVIASRAEAEFVRALAGRTPTQAEVATYAIRLDKLIEPYVLRAGVARPPPIP